MATWFSRREILCTAVFVVGFVGRCGHSGGGFLGVGGGGLLIGLWIVSLYHCSNSWVDFFFFFFLVGCWFLVELEAT